MAAWRKAIKRDPGVSSGEALPRVQLDDHIPAILAAFRERLRSATSVTERPRDAEHIDEAAAHGLKRWQQGYELREVIREWGQLQLCVIDELDQFEGLNANLKPGAMMLARRTWAEMCAEGMADSVNQYFRLQQIEAEAEVRDLERVLAGLRGLDQERAQLWHEAAHDLRGNLGVVVNATAGLTHGNLSDEGRERLLRTLSRNVTSLHAMLEDVMSLARLQAGREQLVIRSYDAAALIHEAGARVQSLMDERGLSFAVEGPTTLKVEGDPVKVQRITQNLLLNAYKYTERGAVTLSYGDSRDNDPGRWMLCVEDTGPGFPVGPGTPLADAIESATEEWPIGKTTPAENAFKSKPSGEESGVPPARRTDHGEGIGLSIIKRLCEMLNATIELESMPQRGTTVRVLFPRKYGS